MLINYKEFIMSKRSVVGALMAVVVLLASAISIAEESEQSPEPAKKQAQERIYGSQLMTKQERAEHRAKLRSLKTREEREAYRLEHHKKMQERAKEKGVMLPDEPPARGGGMGQKGGMGAGGGY